VPRFPANDAIEVWREPVVTVSNRVAGPARIVEHHHSGVVWLVLRGSSRANKKKSDWYEVSERAPDHERLPSTDKYASTERGFRAHANFILSNPPLRLRQLCPPDLQRRGVRLASPLCAGAERACALQAGDRVKREAYVAEALAL
jgi:hypothetical protein